MANEKSKLEVELDEMENYFEGCKPVMFSTDKIQVSKDEIYTLMDELRHDIPDEIKKARRIIKNRDGIIAAANAEAERIKTEAADEAARLVDESEIMDQAYAQSDQIVNEAVERANATKKEASAAAGDIMRGSLSYANDLLAEIEKIVSHAYDTTKMRTDSLVEELRSNLEILQNNRDQILSQLDTGDGESGPASGDEPAPEGDGEDYSSEADGNEGSEGPAPADDETGDFRVDLSGIDEADENGTSDDSEEDKDSDDDSSEDGKEFTEDELNMSLEDLQKGAGVRGKHDPDPDDE